MQSVKETLSSQFVENCKGVVQRLTLQEHKMVWNRTTHLWYVPSAHQCPSEVASEGLTHRNYFKCGQSDQGDTDMDPMGPCGPVATAKMGHVWLVLGLEAFRAHLGAVDDEHIE